MADVETAHANASAAAATTASATAPATDAQAAAPRIPTVGNEISISDYATYEDYLDSQITPIDLYYLEDKDLARQLVELGYRGSGEPLKRDEFESRKKASDRSNVTNRRFQLQAAVTTTAASQPAPGQTQGTTPGTAGRVGTAAGMVRSKSQQQLLSTKPPSGSPEQQQQQQQIQVTPFLRALAEREEANRTGRMTTILFVRDFNGRGQEISGYIDLAHRFKYDNFDDYFNNTRKLLPKVTDLSFYNWETHACVANTTPNFQVIAESAEGVLFKNKRDRKVVRADPKNDEQRDNCTRLEVASPEYTQVVFYDHYIRRKT